MWNNVPYKSVKMAAATSNGEEESCFRYNNNDNDNDNDNDDDSNDDYSNDHDNNDSNNDNNNNEIGRAHV